MRTSNWGRGPGHSRKKRAANPSDGTEPSTADRQPIDKDDGVGLPISSGSCDLIRCGMAATQNVEHPERGELNVCSFHARKIKMLSRIRNYESVSGVAQE